MMLKNDFFGFPKVHWLHRTTEVDKSVRHSCQIFSGFNVPNLLISDNFDRVVQKKKKVDVLRTQCTSVHNV